LLEPSRPARRALKTLQRVAAGAKVAQPADAAVWERLALSGTVRVDAERRLRVGNRIVKELVAARWLKRARGGWRFAAAAAVLAVLLAAGGYWYTQYLPTADFATLGDAAASLREQEDAYRRLRALPGFAERADRAWTEALGRQSAAATTLRAATAVDALLRELPGQDAPADRLLSEFWLRRARAAAAGEQRDAALLMAQRAAALPAAEPRAVAALAALVADDYRYLDRSLRLASAPAYWHMRFADDTLLSLDAEQQSLRTPFGAAAGGGALGAAPRKLSALAPTALVRELAVAGEGTAGELELTLAVQHPAAEELLVTLRAPSGAEATVAVPSGVGAGGVETFAFPATQGSPLAQLADAGVSGVWRLTLVDAVAGNTGALANWSLRFGADIASDDPPEPLAIADPQRVEAVAVLAAGERAVAWPTTSGVVGSIALWNLATGEPERDFTLRAAPRHVALDVTGERLLAATDDTLWLWNALDGALVARVATQTQFVLPPVFSADGAYLAIAERVEGSSPLYSVLRSADASLVASIDGAVDAERWELGPGARYLALLGPPTVVRMLDTRRGAALARLPHAAPVQRLLHASGGAALVTIDAAGAVTAWPLAAPGAPLELGRTTAAASASLATNGARLAYTRGDGAVTVLEVATGAELVRLREPRAAPATTTQLSPDGTQLVTETGTALRRWRLPSAAPAPTAARAEVVPTALALDRALGVAVVGFGSGQVEIAALAQLAAPRAALAYFGHRGAVTVAAIDAARGVGATGGADGIVRLWDSAAGAPIGVVIQPPGEATQAVALGANGTVVASAAGRVVHVAGVADGRVTAELETAGAVTVLAFGPGDATLAVGDDGGAVTLVTAAGAGTRRTVALGAAVTALAFAADGAQLAVGDAAGAVRLVRAADGDVGAPRVWRDTAVRWLDFSADGRVLFVATDEWLHALDATTPALEPVQSRLAPSAAALERYVPAAALAVQRAAFAAGGALEVAGIDLAAEQGAPADGPALVARDWPAALGLRLTDDGEPAAFDPQSR
jgi:subtilisin-like proprotein convertase family protein